jgi:hypothetical protein
LRSRREAKEAERGVSLLHQAGVFERTVAHRKFGLAAVFGDDESVGRERRATAGAPQKVERSFILCLGSIGRVQKNKVDELGDFAEALQQSANAAILYSKAPLDLQRHKILTERGKSRFYVFCKPDVARAATQSLDSNGSSARIQVDKPTPLNPRRDDVEESFAQTVAGRACLKTARSDKLTGTMGACNDAHLLMVKRRPA